jgi:hypothetical protein
MINTFFFLQNEATKVQANPCIIIFFYSAQVKPNPMKNQ